MWTLPGTIVRSEELIRSGLLEAFWRLAVWKARESSLVRQFTEGGRISMTS